MRQIEINASPEVLEAVASGLFQVEAELERVALNTGKINNNLPAGWKSDISPLLTDQIEQRVRTLQENAAFASQMGRRLNDIASEIRRLERELAMQQG